MSLYESEPGVPPARIKTFRQQRRERRWGYPVDAELEPVLYADFFRDVTGSLRHRR